MVASQRKSDARETCSHSDTVIVRIIERKGPMETTMPGVMAWPRGRHFIVEASCKKCFTVLKGTLVQGV